MTTSHFEDVTPEILSNLAPTIRQAERFLSTMEEPRLDEDEDIIHFGTSGLFIQQIDDDMLLRVYTPAIAGKWQLMKDTPYKGNFDEPPSYDVEEIGRFDSWQQCVVAAAKHLVEEAISEAFAEIALAQAEGVDAPGIAERPVPPSLVEDLLELDDDEEASDA